MNTKINKLVSLIFTITIVVVNLATNVFANNTSGDDNEKIIIKVGYCVDYAMIKSPMLDGYEGYGWEYLQKIAEYMDGDYEFEFVVGSWGEGLQRLERGEIDILGPANYTDERAEKFLFTTEVFGTETSFLTSLNPDYLTNNSFNKLKDGTVGVVEGDAIIDLFDDYLKENNLTANVIPTDASSLLYELEQQRFDYFLTGSMQMETSLNVVLSFDTSPVYLMGHQNSAEILDKIDDAIVKIRQNEFMFQEQLYLKYFNWDTTKNQYISDDEYLLLQEQDLYNVGVSNIYANSMSKNSNEILGVSVDIANFIANKAGVDINLVEITPTTTQAELDELDFYFPLDSYDYNNAEKRSDYYMKTPLVIIEKGFYGTKYRGMLGMPASYGFNTSTAQYLMSNQDFEFYVSINDIVADFKSGYLSKMILTDADYRMILQEINNIEHSMTVTEYEIGPKIVFSNNFSDDKIDVINKVISYLSDEEIQSYMLRNIASVSEIERSSMQQKYTIFLVVLTVVLGLALHFYRVFKDKQINDIETHDKLTGLLTQAKFITSTRELLENNPGTDYTLLTLDIDNFKYINEIYGYETGSNLLIHIANCIKKIVGEDTLFARISGDNFILIFESNTSYLGEIPALTNPHSVLLTRIENLIDITHMLTFSIGCYNIPQNSSHEISYMIDSCNIAKSHSKGQLGTTLSIFDEEMRERENIKNNIETNMHSALKNNEFVLYYQPKFDIDTKGIYGAEALVRWIKDDKIIPPNDFIPLFENNGFIEKLDYYVLNQACRFIKNNQDLYIPQISVNLSGVTLMKKDLVSNILDIVKKHSIETKYIDLEITESAFVDHFELAISRINELRELGFTISMDDFGSGISSLGRLRDISIDVLKIDREFIVQFESNITPQEHKKTRTIIKNIVTLAKELEIKTIAEGIETKEQLDFLQLTGCDLGQGYLISRPLPQDDFIKLLETSSKKERIN